MHLRFFLILSLSVTPLLADEIAPLKIDPLWKTESFRKALTGSYGIDSRREPVITVDEEGYLDDAGQKMAAGDRKAAAKVIEESSLTENSPAMLFLLASLQFEEALVDEAIENFEKALKLFPSFRDAHRNLAIAYIQKDDYENGMEHLIRAMELGSNEPVTYGLLAYCHTQNEDYSAALDAYRLANVSAPKEIQWQSGKAFSLLQMGMSKEAFAIFQTLNKKEPTVADWWLRVGETGFGSGEAVSPKMAQESRSSLEFLRRLQRLSGDQLSALGGQYLELTLPDLALETFLGVFDLEDNPEPRTLATMQVQLVEYGAISQSQAFQEKIQSVPNAAEALSLEKANPESIRRYHLALARLDALTGAPESATERLEAYTREFPLDGMALMMLADRYFEDGQRGQAIMTLEQAAEDDAVRANALLRLAQTYVEAGAYGEAVPLLKSSLAAEDRDTVRAYLESVQELVP